MCVLTSQVELASLCQTRKKVPFIDTGISQHAAALLRLVASQRCRRCSCHPSCHFVFYLSHKPFRPRCSPHPSHLCPAPLYLIQSRTFDFSCRQSIYARRCYTDSGEMAYLCCPRRKSHIRTKASVEHKTSPVYGAHAFKYTPIRGYRLSVDQVG